MTSGFFQILLITGSLQGLLLAIYFIVYSSLKGVKLFGFTLLLLAAHLFLVANDNQQFFNDYPHLLHLTWVIPALYGPLILLFVQKITRSDPESGYIIWLYFLPFLILVIHQAPFFLSSALEKQHYILDFEKSVQDDFGLVNQTVNWLHIIYFCVALYYFRKYQKKILNYTAIEEARIHWLGLFLKLILIVVCLGAIVFYSRKFHVPILSSLYPFHFFGVLILIYWCAFRLIRQPLIFQTKEEESFFTQTEHSEKKEPSMQSQHLANQLQNVMENEKLYLTPGLTLHELTTKLQSNKQYVSEAINLVYGKNFYDYVNEFRLKEFADNLKNPKKQHLTLLAIAYESGFNSKATFNTVFKKHFGTTPSNFYRRSQENLEN